MVSPPLTDKVCPVTKAASSEARKATAAAISSGSPMRPNGTARLRASISFGLSGATSFNSCVFVGPGQTTLTLIW